MALFYVRCLFTLPNSGDRGELCLETDTFPYGNYQAINLLLTFASVNREEHWKNNYQMKYYFFLHAPFSRDSFLFERIHLRHEQSSLQKKVYPCNFNFMIILKFSLLEYWR